VAVVLIARDGILALTLLLYRRRGLAPPEVIYLGKAATFVLMSALPFLLAARVDWVGADVIAVPAQALLVWGTALYLYTGALYLGLALGPVRRLPLTAR
jgi:phosphatidylglycerophosphate synthase